MPFFPLGLVHPEVLGKPVAVCLSVCQGRAWAWCVSAGPLSVDRALTVAFRGPCKQQGNPRTAVTGSSCSCLCRFLQHRRQQRGAFREQPPGFRSGLIRRDRIRMHYLHRHHHHLGGTAAQVPQEAPQTLSTAHDHAVTQHTGHTQARWQQ